MISLLKTRKNFLKITFKNVMYVILILCFLRLIFFHFQVITNPFQNEYREGAMLLTTDLLLKGANPFDLNFQPIYTNCYGIFYHIVIMPLAALFGNTLTIHRIVSALSIWFACYLFFQATRQIKTSIFLGLSATCILYNHLLFGTTPLARPDSLGFLLFFSSIFIPWKLQYSKRSLIASIALAILAWLTKFYFILTIPALASYLFIFKSKHKGIKYLFSSVLAILVVVIIFNQIFETYWYNTFFTVLSVSKPKSSFLLKQLLMYFNRTWLLILLPCIYLNYLAWKRINTLYKFKSPKFRSEILNKIDTHNFNKPLIDSSFDLMPYVFIFTSVIFCLKLGRSDGNWVYQYQLISPFLLLTILEIIQFNRRIIPLFSLLVIFNIVTLAPTSFMHFARPNYSSNWNNLRHVISQHKNIYSSPSVASILFEQHKPIYDTGLSELFPMGFERRSSIKKIFPVPSRFVGKYKEFNNEIASSVKSKSFDLIILTKGSELFDSYFISKKLLEEFYKYRETIDISMPNHYGQRLSLTIWEPK